MHNAAFRAKGLNYCYLPFLVRRDKLPRNESHYILNMQGVNICPHKEAAIPFDELSRKFILKAVNTGCKQGRLAGYNTDVDGFHLLQNNFGILYISQNFAAEARVLRGCFPCLGRVKARSLIIVNRTVKAERLATLLNQRVILPKTGRNNQSVGWAAKAAFQALPGLSMP